ncbi:MAG: helix-turn-helix transcriptional regulator [Gammaproteobacteria bacterium]|jgi:putative molybdopterin biosynthesis protein
MSAVLQQQNSSSMFMSVREVAEYLQLNEKKIYSLVNEQKIPATKVTGKWMFPRELVDRWMLNSTHGGLMTDRLVIAGSDDPLLYRIVMQFTQDVGNRALISYSTSGTRMGLELLQSNRADICGIHWGPKTESHMRHPALLHHYSHHRQWVLIHAFRREQGLMIHPRLQEHVNNPEPLFEQRYRWALRQSGAGAQRFLMEMLSGFGLNSENLTSTITALSEREAAAAIVMGQADVAPGARSAAHEFGLEFIPFGWESFDLVMTRDIWFRRLFQELVSRIRSQPCQSYAEQLTGYDLTNAGELIWGDD